MTGEPEQTFAQLLRQARREAGLTQEELAEQAGISPRAISSLERGINRAPRRDTLELLFTALKLTKDEQRQWEQLRRRSAVRSPVASALTGPDFHRQPETRTSFLGRETEIAEVEAALGESRLVTITGPGGVGKTRCGLAVINRVQHHFPDGVYFVPLAATGQSDRVAVAIIRAMELDENAERSTVETLIRFINDRSILLMLDNFEHVVAAAPLLSQILEACPAITMLVTSRTPLRLTGEQEYQLQPLDENAAAELFIERAREIRSGFEPDEPQSAVIREICRRLDGLPLAIELAAARSRVLTPQALLQKLEHPLAVLAGGPRDVPARQQTLRAAISWSYDLLEPNEQDLLMALAIFRDGWSLEAAEAMVPGDSTILDALEALVESSLIEFHPGSGGEPRFRMLETVREFGLELLAQDSREHDFRERHARYVARVVLTVPPLVIGPDLTDGLETMETEHANIQVALDWFLQNDITTGLRMTASLSGFWWMRSHLTVGRAYCDRMLDAADDSIDPAIVATVLTGAGIITLAENDVDRVRARSLNEQALSIFLDLQDPPEGSFWPYISLGMIATRDGNLQDASARCQQAMNYARHHDQQYGILISHLMLAILSGLQGELEDALSHCEAAIARAHEYRDPWTTSVSSMNLAVIYIQQERYDEAWQLLNEALRLSRQLKNSRDTGWALDRMAAVEMKRGHIAEAKDLFLAALEASNRAGETRGIGNAKLGLGQTALQQDQPEEAEKWFGQALEICLEAGHLRSIAGSIEGLASVADRLSDPTRAVLLRAAAIAFCERVGIASPEVDRSGLEHEYVTAQQNLSTAEFEEAWQAGGKLTPEQIAARTQNSPAV